MADPEVRNPRATLEARRLELAAEIGGRLRELAIGEEHPKAVDSLAAMNSRDEILGLLSRISSMLADVERCLQDL